MLEAIQYLILLPKCITLPCNVYVLKDILIQKKTRVNKSNPKVTNACISMHTTNSLRMYIAHKHLVYICKGDLLAVGTF